MSDINLYGIVSSLLGIAFAGVGALVVIVAGIVVAVRKANGHRAFGPGSLGACVSGVLLLIAGGGALFAAESWPRETDDSLLVWGPLAFVLSIVGGVVAGVFSRGEVSAPS